MCYFTTPEPGWWQDGWKSNVVCSDRKHNVICWSEVHFGPLTKTTLNGFLLISRSFQRLMKLRALEEVTHNWCSLQPWQHKPMLMIRDMNPLRYQSKTFFMSAPIPNTLDITWSQFLLWVWFCVCLCVFRYLDFISVKTFDLHGSQDQVTAHHSSLYSESNASVVIIHFLVLPFMYSTSWMFIELHINTLSAF